MSKRFDNLMVRHFNERERKKEREREYIQVEYKTMKCQTMLRLFKSQPKLCHAEATTPFLNHHLLPEVSHSIASNDAIIFIFYMSDYNKIRKPLKLDRVPHLCSQYYGCKSHKGRGVESLRNSPKITKKCRLARKASTQTKQRKQFRRFALQ